MHKIKREVLERLINTAAWWTFTKTTSSRTNMNVKEMIPGLTIKCIEL